MDSLSRLASILLLAAPLLCHGTEAPVPLKDFFRNPAFADVQISPDGRFISAITYTEKFPEARNLVVMEVGKWDDARLVTSYKNEEIRWYEWADSERLVFKVDRDYDDVNRNFEYVGFYSVRHDGKAGRVLHEPFMNDRRSRGTSSSSASVVGGLREDIEFLSDLPGDPDHILVSKRDSFMFPDAYRLNLLNGKMTVAAQGEGVYLEWIADNAGLVRAAIGRGQSRDDLEYELVYRPDEASPWQTVSRFDTRSEIQVHGFDVDDLHLWVSARIDDDRMALYRMNPQTREFGPAIAADPEYDVGTLPFGAANSGLVSARDGTPLYMQYASDLREKVFIDQDWQIIQQVIDGALPDTHNDIVDWDLRWARLIVHAWSDRDPGSYFLFDRESGTLRHLLQPMPWLDPRRMSPMEPVVFKARDGMKIHGYLTRPSAQSDAPVPMIVHPHGGPFGIRDVWAFNPEVQFLASRGYAVLQVNFRGSGGYGFDFEAAGYRRWGLEMQDDLTDAVEWAIEAGIADPDNIGIYGASYGGYATMMGLVKTPELYRVGINYVGVVDLPRMYRDDTRTRSVEGIQDWFRNWWVVHIGDPKADAAQLHDTSPINFVERIQAPVMVIHGRLDWRLDIDSQYWPLVRALKAGNKPHEAMVKRFEGHGFFKEKNQIELYSAIQAFLSRYMPTAQNPPAEAIAGTQ
jgi:dipeptidyl aminopeptidase/acylaminoacyl peptidase